MTKEQIINAIADACKDDSLRFQIVMQNNSLYVYVNRPSKIHLDYQQLRQKIYAALAKFPLAEFEQILLYSRPWGEVEPDWQSALEIDADSLASADISSMVEAITSVVDTTNSIVAKIERELDIPESFADDPQIDFEDLPTTAGEEAIFNLSEAELAEILDDSVKEIDRELEQTPPSLERESAELSDYCFIRNRRLLYAVLDIPWIKIANLVNTFADLPSNIQRSQLPTLETYFESSLPPSLKSVAPAVREWWNEIQQLDSDNKHKLAIWLSRYCLEPDKTMVTIKEAIIQANKAQQLEKSNLNVPTESRLPTTESALEIPAQSGAFHGFFKIWQKLWQKIKFNRPVN